MDGILPIRACLMMKGKQKNYRKNIIHIESDVTVKKTFIKIKNKL